jgi:arylsulfatase A-like enzyme
VPEAVSSLDHEPHRLLSRLARLVPQGVLAALLLTAAPVSAQQNPSVLVIMLDDHSHLEWRADAMPQVFSRIIPAGTSFSQFTVNTPLCGPSRATALTGLYPHNHRVRFCPPDPQQGKWNLYHVGGYAGTDQGKQFQRLGYYTAMIGKYINSYGQPRVMQAAYGGAGHDNDTPPGWDDFRVTMGRTYTNYEIVENGARHTESTYMTDYLRDRVLDAIATASQAGKPFLIHFWPMAPHASWDGSPIYHSRHAHLFTTDVVPWDPDYNAPLTGKHPQIADLQPLTTGQLYGRNIAYQNRLRAVKAVDEAIGAFLDDLEAREALANTIIVVTSDNGFKLGHFRMSAKLTPYGRDTDVPFVIRGPGIRAQTRTERVSMVDIHPTLLQLAGSMVPSSIDGQSFSHLLAGASGPWRNWALVESWTDETVSMHPERTARWEYVETAAERGRFIRWWDGYEEYYDLGTDPYQLTNAVSTLEETQLRKARARIDSQRACIGTGCHDWGGQPPPY